MNLRRYLGAAIAMLGLVVLATDSQATFSPAASSVQNAAVASQVEASSSPAASQPETAAGGSVASPVTPESNVAPSGVAPGVLPRQAETEALPSPVGLVFNVVTYGADGSGVLDSTVGIRSAIAAAEATAGISTVYFPAGTYLLNDNDGAAVDFKITGPNTVDVLGAGRLRTKIVEKVGTVAYPGISNPKTVFVFEQTTGNVFSGLTVDTQTYNAGDPVHDYGNDTTIEHATFLGANNANAFALRVTAVCNRQDGVHRSGNLVHDITLSGEGIGGNADLDFSCQWNGRVSNITDTGWGMAIYIDQHVTVDNYAFTPGTYEKSAPGWYVTDSNYISLNNFVTSGLGGIIKNPTDVSSHITINHEQMTNPNEWLTVGDAAAVTIANSSIAGLLIAPAVSMNGLTVTDSSIGSVTCKPQPGASITGLVGVSCGG
jgi:hypothetical protein